MPITAKSTMSSYSLSAGTIRMPPNASRRGIIAIAAPPEFVGKPAHGKHSGGAGGRGDL